MSPERPFRIVAAAPTKAGGHRAMDDIKESLDELRYYRANLLIDPEAAEGREPS